MTTAHVRDRARAASAMADIHVHSCTGPVALDAADALNEEFPALTEIINAGRPEETPRKAGKRW